MALGVVSFLLISPVILLSHAVEYRFYDNATYILMGDLLLTPEQHISIQERNFVISAKWPKVGNEIVIPYYLDGEEAEKNLGALMSTAAEKYYAVTCIKWLKVSSSDNRYKVRVYEGNGCHSTVGYLGFGNRLSLGNGCKKLDIVMHEMGHTMGLHHTQCREDRDDFVEIWPQNIKKSELSNFKIEYSDAYGVPYDYRSVMHYANTAFSTNFRFSMTSKNPYYQFSMGERNLDLIFTDRAILNLAYSCPQMYESSCKKKVKCQNGGFMNKNCKCECPENTKGARCQTVTEFFYSKQPECGGNITSPQTIKSDNYPDLSTNKKCIYWIKAPTCQVPEITVTFAKFYGQSCLLSMLAIKYLEEKFDDYYCDGQSVPVGTVFKADSSEAVVYYFNSYEGYTDYGFTADVKFVPDKSCETVITTTQAPILPPTILKDGPCELTVTDPTNLEYTAPGFDKPLKSKAICRLDAIPANPKSFIFSDVWVYETFKANEEITIQDRFGEKKFTIENRGSKAYVVWPFTIKFDSRDGFGSFRINIVDPTLLPNICHSKIIEVDEINRGVVTNPFLSPLYGFLRGDSCVFMMKAPKGKQITVTSSIPSGLKEGETLGYTKDLPGSSALSYFTKYYEIAKIKADYVFIYYTTSPTHDSSEWTIYGDVY